MSITYTEEQLESALQMAAEGEPIRAIISKICTNSNSFWKFRQECPSFAKKFEQARQDGLELLADDLLTITETQPDVNKARLISDNTKWLLSKRKPLVYGDRLDINLNQTVDIAGALTDARNRLRDVTPPIEQIASKTGHEDSHHEVYKQKGYNHKGPETSAIGSDADSETDIFS